MEFGKKAKEEYAIILDFLPNGYPLDKRPMFKKNPIAQAIGKDHFSLLELIPRKGITLKPHEVVYIGEGKREKIHHVAGKLPADKLTQTANMELEYVVEKIVNQNEKKYVNFFNKAGAITTRMHQIELLPGIGKKHMWQILEERDKKPFEDFEDLKVRVKLLPEPKKAIIKRIISEIKGEDKYRLFIV